VTCPNGETAAVPGVQPDSSAHTPTDLHCYAWHAV